MQASFLIPAYNEERFIARSVESVHRSARDCRLDSYEVVVCDNASTDATTSLAAAAGARVVREAHRQIARARNAAAAASSGEWLVWLDADAVLDAHVLRGTLSALGSGKCCGGGARIHLEGAGDLWLTRTTVAVWNGISRVMRVAAGSYFFAVREGWEATGGFDERFYAGEELGFSRALKRWGRKRGMRFVIVDGVVNSSARKVGQYTTVEAVRQMLVFMWPGNLRRRDRCAFWYDRRDEGGG